MASNSWNVKGIEPSARAAAKAAAKRERVTLGVWLGRTILKIEADGGPTSDLETGPTPELESVEQALRDLDRRLDALERANRTELAAARSSRQHWQIATVGAMVIAVLTVGYTMVTPLLEPFGKDRIAQGSGPTAPIVPVPDDTQDPADTPEASAPEPEPLATAGAEPEKFTAVTDQQAADLGNEASATATAAEPVAVATMPGAEDRSAGMEPEAENDEDATPEVSEPEAENDEDATPEVSAVPTTPLAQIEDMPEVSAETVEQFQKAAREGSQEAQFNVGILYAEGMGVAQDYDEALIWFGRAAEQGLANAQYNLAAIHEHGLVGPPDTEKAREWYLRAAEQNHPQAQHNLAVIFARGTGVTKDYTMAAKWFAAAAEQGLVNAQYNLAMLYERGLGVRRDEALAYKWFSLADKQGDGGATTAREALAARLAPADRAEIDRAVEAWHPASTDAENAPAGDATATGTDADPTTGEKALVARVQALLTDLGFDPGPADGVVGDKTRDAIRDYQNQLGLVVDGQVSTVLLSHLESVTGN
jgi:localization factor PodJL